MFPIHKLSTLWFDFRRFPGVKIAMMNFEEIEKLQNQLKYVDLISKAFIYSSIFTGWIVFFVMKDAGDISLWVPIWIFVAVVMMITQIPVWIFLKNTITQPLLDDISLWEKVEISTKIVSIIESSKWKYVQILNGEVPVSIKSLTSLDNFAPWENVILGIAPKTNKIVSIKKFPL